jgi:DNA-binding XRE family transcriptional regulator
MGKPLWIPTPDILKEAENYASLGLTREQIAHNLGIGESTFYDKKKNYPEFEDAIKRGEALGITHVSNALFKNATVHNNVTAQIFYLKCRAKWDDGTLDDKENNRDKFKKRVEEGKPCSIEKQKK